MIRLLLISLAFFLAGCLSEERQDPFITAERIFDSRSESEHTEFHIQENERKEYEISEPSGPITLDEVLCLTVKHNPELKAYGYEIRSADVRMLAAGLSTEPMLDVEVENIWGEEDFGGTDSAEITMQISRLIEMGDKINKRKKVASYDLELAELDYKARVIDVTTEAAKSYIELLYIQEKRKLSEKLIDTCKNIVDSVQKRVDAGRDGPLALSKARLWLANAKLEHLEAVKYQDVIRSRLSSFWGNKNSKFTSAVGNLDKINPLPELEQIFNTYQKNPLILRGSIEIQQKIAEQQLARSRSFADIELAGGFKHFNENDETAFVIGLSLPLKDSKRNYYKRIEAANNLLKSRQKYEESVMVISNEIRKLHSDLKSSYEKIMIYRKEILSASDTVFKGSRISYDQGRIDYLELLDAQKTYFSVKDKYIDLLSEYNIAGIQLKRITGTGLKVTGTLNK